MNGEIPRNRVVRVAAPRIAVPAAPRPAAARRRGRGRTPRRRRRFPRSESHRNEARRPRSGTSSSSTTRQPGPVEASRCSVPPWSASVQPSRWPRERREVPARPRLSRFPGVALERRRQRRREEPGRPEPPPRSRRRAGEVPGAPLDDAAPDQLGDQHRSRRPAANTPARSNNDGRKSARTIATGDSPAHGRREVARRLEVGPRRGPSAARLRRGRASSSTPVA